MTGPFRPLFGPPLPPPKCGQQPRHRHGRGCTLGSFVSQLPPAIMWLPRHVDGWRSILVKRIRQSGSSRSSDVTPKPTIRTQIPRERRLGRQWRGLNPRRLRGKLVWACCYWVHVPPRVVVGAHNRYFVRSRRMPPLRRCRRVHHEPVCVFVVRRLEATWRRWWGC